MFSEFFIVFPELLFKTNCFVSPYNGSIATVIANPRQISSINKRRQNKTVALHTVTPWVFLIELKYGIRFNKQKTDIQHCCQIDNFNPIASMP